jgi:hypothetical protein
MNIQKYLLHSTLFAIFSGAFMLRIGFDLKLMYIIVLVNSLIIAKKYAFFFAKKLNFILFIIFLFGLLTVYLYGNELGKMSFQIIGIFVIGNYFYNFYKNTSYSLTYIFEKYCKYAYIVSIIGLVFVVVNYVAGIDISYEMSKILPYGYPGEGAKSGYRLHSILLEPAHFAGVVLPAFFYNLYYFKKKKKEFICILIALLLSFSSVGYIGILVSLIIASSGSLFKKIIVVGVSLIFGITTYVMVDDVRMRVDDTIGVLSRSDYDFNGINLSTYALISNFYVTTMVIKDSPIIGHGIGSHPISHKLYIKGVNIGESFEELGFEGINDDDANSLLLRIFSELGILGVLFMLYFIIKNYSEHYHVISKCILVYFFYKLFRDGAYFSPEMYFFVFMYINVNKQSMVKLKNKLGFLPILKS